MRQLRTTADNPGAFQAVQRPSLRGTLRAVLKQARARHFQAALLQSISGAANAAEPWLSRFVGPRFACPCCGHEGAFFVHRTGRRSVTWNSVCPACSARSRHRGLSALLPLLLDERRPARVLHIAPEPVLARLFAGRAGLVYETADLFLEDVTHRRVDLQATPFADGAYDLVLCNHVLEHIERDDLAIAELARILRPGGTAVITVPGDFSRDRTVSFRGELPNGHYRDYGMDLVAELRRAFAVVDPVDMHRFDPGPDGRRHAIRPRELAFVCTR